MITVGDLPRFTMAGGFQFEGPGAGCPVRADRRGGLRAPCLRRRRSWPGSAWGGVAWFALGPREVYVPSYPVSRRYVNNINVSNTTVNTTVINNVYNTQSSTTRRQCNERKLRQSQCSRRRGGDHVPSVHDGAAGREKCGACR